MRKSIYKINAFFLIIATFLVAGCHKPDSIATTSDENEKNEDAVCYDCDYLKQAYADVDDHATQLGEKLQNPYLIENISRAYQNLHAGSSAPSFSPNSLYVEFQPKNFQELDKLEQLDLDLFDYPLDRRLLTEGDYYVQEGKSVEDLPYYYAVVPSNYSFPSWIAYRVIDNMFIPDNDPTLEVEALRISGNLDEEEEQSFSNSQLTRKKLDEVEVNSAGHSSNSPEACAHFPNGKIVVENVLAGGNSYRGVRQAKVVVRRLFKVERMLTDDNGFFRCSKYFHNKYTVLVKFKNEYARVSRMRPWAIHEQFFPIKINFGRWKNLECGHEFRISNPNVGGTIATSHWCAAIVQNGVLEHREMAKAMHIGLPPKALTIMLSSKKGAGHGNTYMLNMMLHNNADVNSVETLVAAVVIIWSPVTAALTALALEAYKQRCPDIKYGYGGDPSYLTTDRYCELVYHELSHAIHYAAVGDNWWLKLGLAENKNPGIGSYGECCTNYAPRIALAEGWAYYMGHLMADQKWGMGSTAFPEQGDFDTDRFMLNFAPTASFSSHINFLESFDPTRSDDPNHWIPKGLLYDLSDGGTEAAESHISDNVSGFRPEQFFNALQSGTPDVNAFKQTLLSQNHNYQRDQVISLFHQYGY